jgi:hypothetical protein
MKILLAVAEKWLLRKASCWVLTKLLSIGFRFVSLKVKIEVETHRGDESSPILSSRDPKEGVDV